MMDIYTDAVKMQGENVQFSSDYVLRELNYLKNKLNSIMLILLFINTSFFTKFNQSVSINGAFLSRACFI